jgi:hypothetical protein
MRNPSNQPIPQAPPAQNNYNPVTSQQLLQQARALSAAASANAKPIQQAQQPQPAQTFPSVVPQLVPPQPQAYPPQPQQQISASTTVPPQPQANQSMAQPARLQQLSMLQSQVSSLLRTSFRRLVQR